MMNLCTTCNRQLFRVLRGQPAFLTYFHLDWHVKDVVQQLLRRKQHHEVRERGRAGEVVQKTHLTLRSLVEGKQLDSDKSIRGLIATVAYGVIRNEGARNRRSHQRDGGSSDDILQQHPGPLADLPDAVLFTDRMLAHAHAYFEQQSETVRLTIELHYQGIEYAEIARRANTNLLTIRQRVSRFHRGLREYLEKHSV